ncbi:Mu transposase domain-containing protein [Streptomyces sp. NBC_01320]|uniref:Mu transposase domain-containing protein n=1 Tax=Streptomyces sp. NBC_01320 TaxID=2903824 RepID=UPI002E1319A9|nr:hypothetical protein OG395_50205 [Streptomyces sp. NBC_01320]
MEPFKTVRLSTPRVDRYSQMCVRMNRYSVPVRLIGRTVRVSQGETSPRVTPRPASAATGTP